MLLRNIRKFGNTPLSIAEIFAPNMASGLHEFSDVITQFNAYGYNFKGALLVPTDLKAMSTQQISNSLIEYSIDVSKTLRSSAHITVFNQFDNEYIVKLLVGNGGVNVTSNMFMSTSKSQMHVFNEALECLHDMMVRCK